MSYGAKKIGRYDKSVQGKKAVLTQEVKFLNEITLNKQNMKVFPIGTEIIASHEVIGTGLTTFTFKHNNRSYQHPVREGKFQYIN